MSRIEYLVWAPDRETFITDMLAQRLPGDRPICRLPEGDEQPADGGSLIWIDGIAAKEWGAVVKTPGTYDDEGAEITPPVVIPGHHVNLLACAWLAEFLNAGGGWTAILGLLGEVAWQPSSVGEPEGWVGTSGVKLFPATQVTTRACVWA